MDESVIQLAQQRLGHTFADPSLLVRALHHASASDDRLLSNERLEFLGDAVLGLICCEMIFTLFPRLLEGEMTKIKSTVVSRQTCAAIAIGLRLDDLLVLGKGMRTQKAIPSSLSAAVTEAVVAAIYLDAGLEGARRFLGPILEPLIRSAEASGHQENFKSVLQQHAVQLLGQPPAYVVLDEQGPDHAKCFEVCVEVGERRFPSCWGQSKKQAEQLAALAALQQLGVVEVDGDGAVSVVRGEATP